MKQLVILMATLGALALAQQYTTPVPILKQINRQNEDGSYSYGYEAADGSFKIETKHPTGEVYGKYGYVDESGKLREVEYGASKRGFEPQGTDINVPPPTLGNDYPNAIQPLGPNEVDDGQYREDPSVYYKDEKYNTRPAPTPSNFRLNTQQNYNPAPRQYYPETAPEPQQQYFQQPRYQPSQQHRFQYQNAQPSYNSQPSYYQPQAQPRYQAHPATTNVDINTGSYTLTYSG